MNIATATSFKRLLVAENQKADQLRRERDEAVALLRITWRAVQGYAHLTTSQIDEIEGFLSRLDAKGGK